MSDLIERQDAIDALFIEPLYESGMKKRDADAVVPAIYEKIKSLPSAPQRTGRWLPDTRAFCMKFVCSECKESLNVDTVNLKPSWNFCPNCGARMEGCNE